MAERNDVHQFVALRQCGGDGADVRSAAEPIQNRKTVGQDSGAERAEQDIFQGGFIRTLFAAQETSQHVEAEGHGLQAEKHDDQVYAGSHEHHADAGKQQERVVFALLLFACVGMMFMASGIDLIVMFLGLETMALSFYVLTGFLRREKRSNEA